MTTEAATRKMATWQKGRLACSSSSCSPSPLPYTTGPVQIPVPTRLLNIHGAVC